MKRSTMLETTLTEARIVAVDDHEDVIATNYMLVGQSMQHYLWELKPETLERVKVAAQAMVAEADRILAGGEDERRALIQEKGYDLV